MTERRFTFDNVADLYQNARPDYPEALFDDITAGLSPVARILEIGSGTGKATQGFARRGFSVLGIEPGAEMIRVAEARFATSANVQFIQSTFEAWEPEESAFGLVVAAQSIHWVPAEIAFPKAARLLAPDGMLALFGNVPMPLPSPFREQMAQIYARHNAEEQSRLAEVWYLPSGRASSLIANSGFFRPATHRSYAWQREYTSESYVALLQTLSSYQMMDAETREPLLADVARAVTAQGGKLELGYETHIYTAQLL
jgi:SAM-dependent methyltransferase